MTKSGALALRIAAAFAIARPAAARAQDFAHFVQNLRPAAAARGISLATFDRAFAGVTLDPAVEALTHRQPEFERPLQAYVEAAVSPRRLEAGGAALGRWRSPLAEIQSRSGVPREIIVAIWGMESDFGADTGGKYVVRSLATLAFARPSEPAYRAELLAALDILQKGAATRASLLGSWAGAMGHPQFLPSAYEKYAVTYAGHHAPDIWHSIPDSLASIANFLKAAGWKRALPWALEVKVPAGFDYASLKQSFTAWRSQGFRAEGGGALPRNGEADLFLPAGAQGPAFLLATNYWVIKTYNISDSYAMSVGVLADRLAGGRGIVARWPKGPLLDAKARAKVQALLARLGFYRGKMDGKIGPLGRDAIHAFQRSVGFAPADGYASPALLTRLERAVVAHIGP